MIQDNTAIVGGHINLWLHSQKSKTISFHKNDLLSFLLFRFGWFDVCNIVESLSVVYSDF